MSCFENKINKQINADENIAALGNSVQGKFQKNKKINYGRFTKLTFSIFRTCPYPTYFKESQGTDFFVFNLLDKVFGSDNIPIPIEGKKEPTSNKGFFIAHKGICISHLSKVYLVHCES